MPNFTSVNYILIVIILNITVALSGTLYIYTSIAHVFEDCSVVPLNGV